MKVAVVIDSLSLGGAERLLATLAGEAPAAGLELSVISIAGPHGDRASLRPVLEAAGLQPEFLSISRLAHPTAIPRVRDAIRRSGCSVVHAHLEYACTLAPPAAALAGRPVVCSLHHVPAPLRGRERWKERLAVGLASRSKRLIFVSRAAMDGFAARYRPRPTWDVVPNGVDLVEFHPGSHEPLPDLGVPNGAPVVALVAALRQGKGHEAAIAAWPAVTAEHPQACLVFAGAGCLETDLREKAAAAGVADRVIFAGARTDVARIMRGSSLILLPSGSEALPTVLMEAAACGRPVVATAVGGIPEIVSDGVTGRLIDKATPAAIAAAVSALLRDPPRCAAMGQAARRRAERDFGMGTWARRLRSVYEDAVHG